MMYKWILLIVVISLYSCKPAQDEAFLHVFQELQEKTAAEPLLRAFTEKRLFFDSLLLIPQKGEVQRILDFSKSQLHALHEFDLERIDAKLHEHYNNSHSFLSLIIKNIEEDKIHQTNPEFYTVLPFLKTIQHQHPKQLATSLDLLDVYFQTAIENLKTPKTEKLELVITEAIAGYEFLSNEVESHLYSLKLEKTEEKALVEKLGRVQIRLKDYIAFCNSKLFDARN